MYLFEIRQKYTTISSMKVCIPFKICERKSESGFDICTKSKYIAIIDRQIFWNFDKYRKSFYTIIVIAFSCFISFVEVVECVEVVDICFICFCSFLCVKYRIYSECDFGFFLEIFGEFYEMIECIFMGNIFMVSEGESSDNTTYKHNDDISIIS